MPPFVDSFGDQFTAVLINAIGTIAASLFSTIFSIVATNVLTPMLQAIVAGFGIAG